VILVACDKAGGYGAARVGSKEAPRRVDAMSALVMILTVATMAVGEERASAKAGQGFVLQEKWEGSLRIDPEYTVSASYQDGKLTVIRFGMPETASLELIDQGEGKCLCRCAEQEALGIYKWKNQQLVLCIGRHEHRPSSFRVEDGLLLTLQRVKAGR
jgi:hypothetical protein